MKIYDTAKLAISELANVELGNLKKVYNFGIENDAIYSCGDKIFKVTSARQEYLASKRIIGQDFKNVVKIYDSFECNILGYHDDTIWKSYIIEEEKLTRERYKFVFKDLDLYTLSVDVENRLPYFVSVINGLAELNSIGIRYDDLHSLNIMSTKDGVIKILDFGYVSIKRKFNKTNMRVYLDNKEKGA